MKHIGAFGAILISITLNAQKFDCGVVFTSGSFVKLVGTIEISDSTVVIAVSDQGKASTSTYNLVRRANNLIYFTDGVMTHSFAMIDEAGTKKGFKFDKMIVFSLDKRQSEISMTYYATEIH